MPDLDRSTTKVPPESNSYLHEHTAANGNLNYISPLKPKNPKLKYNLGTGILDSDTIEKENMTGTETYFGFNNATTNGKKSSELSGINSASTGTHRSKKRDPNSYKIFLLLLQPKLKTFELIQLIYSPMTTTVGNIIKMIPENATEPALGSQAYNGLCRPKTGEEILDRDLLASETCRKGKSVESAKITLGEILVAIPDGYTGSDVSALSKQILSNPKIVKLLKRSDPLAPKRSRRSTRKNHRRNSRRSRSKEHVEVMEKFDEEDEIKQENEKDQERRMKEAMEHAAKAAAASNAAIPGGDSPSYDTITNRKISKEFVRAPSIVSLDGSTVAEKSAESSLQESLDDSYSSWSKSFDASFAATSSVCSESSKRIARRRDRHSRRVRIIQRSCATAFVLMIAMYFLDPRGYQRSDQEKLHDAAVTFENPMGWTGILQCVFLFVSLYHIELFVRTTANSDEFGGDDSNRYSFLKLLQSTTAMKKLKARFSKKLKKTIAARGPSAVEECYESSTSTRKLRSFSLKPQQQKVDIECT